MLSGILLVVITMVFLLQGTASSANNSVGNTMKTASTLVDPSYYIPGAKPVFVPPTPADGAWGTSQPNISAVIAVTAAKLYSLTYNWNGTNTSFYDPSLVLSMSFDDNAGIGETASKAVDVSQYGNNGTIYGNTILLLHFNEGVGNVAYDESAFKSNASLLGGVSWTPNGKSGSAVSFNWTNNTVVSAPMPASMPANFTLISWFNPAAVPPSFQLAYGIIIYPGYHTGLFYNSDQTIGATAYNTAGSDYVSYSNTSYAPNQWIMAALTINQVTKSFRLYVNGQYNSGGTYTGTLNIGNFFNIGAALQGNCNTNWYWCMNGSIDEVGVFGRTLTDSEILAQYNAGRVKHADWDPNGEWNSAMKFDGAHDYVDAGNGSSLNITGSAITVSAWIKPNSNPTNDYWIAGNARDMSPPSGGYEMFLSSTNLFLAYIWKNSTSTIAAVSGSAAPNGVWSYVAFTFNGTNLITYQNGSQTGTVSIASDTLQPAPFHLIVGSLAYAPSLYVFNGSIDEVRVWNRALSAQEIAMQYASNLYKYDNSTWYFNNNNYNLPVGGYSFALYANAGRGKDLTSDLRTVHVCSIPFVPC